MTYLNPKFVWGPNLAFFAFGPWVIIHGIGPKLADISNMNFDEPI